MKKWVAILNNGSTVDEESSLWNDIKDQISYLYLDINGQKIYLPKNAERYEQNKSASADIASGKVEIESRNITAKFGNIIVKVRVKEKDNNINIDIQSV